MKVTLAGSLSVATSTRDGACPSDPLASLLRVTVAALGVPAEAVVLTSAEIAALQSSPSPADQWLGELCQRAMVNDAPFLLAGTSRPPAPTHGVAAVQSPALQSTISFAGFPLRADDGTVLAVLSVTTLRPHTFSSGDLEVLHDAAESAASWLVTQQALQQITQRASQMQRMLDNSTNVITCAVPGKPPTFISAASKSVLGFNHEDMLVGAKVLKIHPEDFDLFYATEAAALHSPQTVDIRVAHAEGHWVLLRIDLTSVLDEDGRVEMHSSSRDVTVEVATTREVERARAGFTEALDSMPRSITLAQVVRDETGTPTELTVRWANRHLLHTMQASLPDIAGRTFAEVFPAVCAAGLQDRYLEVARTATPMHEVVEGFLGEHIQGSFELVVTPWSDDGLLIENTDVTEQTQAKIALQRSERMLASSYRAAGIGSFEYDLGSDRATWSPEMFEIYGVDAARGAPPVHTLSTYFHPDDLGVFLERRKELYPKNTNVTSSFRIIRSDGTVRHLYEWAHLSLAADGRLLRVTGAIQDQTENREREIAMANSRELERLVVDLSPIGIALLDEDGRYLQVNNAFCMMLGYRREELLALRLTDVIHPEDRDLEGLSHSKVASGDSLGTVSDKRYVHANGRPLWVSVHKTLLRSSDDSQPVRVLAQVIDISERQQRADELTRQARTDALTGLANRRSWEPRLRSALAEAQTHDTPLAVAILDLDRFKQFNDTFGHPVGDQLLIETSAAWRAYLIRHAPRALLARLGGEEFGVLLPRTDPETARMLLEGMGAVIKRDQTVSAGYTLVASTDDVGILMTRADAALYTAKHNGRARVEYLPAFQTT